jgi:DNA-binding LytR/AlgR family response regulator
LEAIDYLLKPIAFSRFVRAVQRASNALLNQVSIVPDAIPDDYIFVKSDHKRKMIKIDLGDVVYIEGRGNYVAFHVGKEKIVAYLSMKDLEERLPLTQFIRVHKSYIVAVKHISTIDNTDLIIKGTREQIPVGSSYKQAFMDKMKNRLLDK